MAIEILNDKGVLTVNIKDGLDSAGNAVTGTENLLLQLALDRAAANTARVSIMQADLRKQTDDIDKLNATLSKLLTSTVDPALNGVNLGISFDAQAIAGLALLPGGSAAFLTTTSPPVLKSDKSLNDLSAAVKSALNSATSQNQQAVINYQSLINQRNQMTEWVANLVQLLAAAASQTTNNLR